ncbi:MAG: LysR substrate-binding domain-containing protein [Marinomonas sp.]
MNNSHLPSTIALSCFEATARHLSVTMAADELCLTQSAVSRQIKRLEQQLGCSLFLRVKQRLILTEGGLEYAAQVTKYMALLNAATINLKASRQTQLRIGAEPSLTARWLLPLIDDFKKAHPEVSLDFVTEMKNLYEAQQGFDLAILYGDGRWPEFDSTFLMCPKMYAVCTPDLLQQYGPITKREDILKYPLLHHMAQDVSCDLSSTQIWLKSIGLSQAEIAGISSQHFEHFQFLLDAALHGLGVTVLPSYFIDEELKSGRLVKASTEPLVAKNYYIAIRKGINNSNCQRFKDWLLKEVKA